MKRERPSCWLTWLVSGGVLLMTGDDAFADAAAAAGEEESALSAEQIDAWIRQLGDAKVQTRERATKALIAAGVPAARAVWKAATESRDAEVRMRAMHAAREIEKKAARALEAVGGSVHRQSDDNWVRSVSTRMFVKGRYDGSLELVANGCREWAAPTLG